MPVLPAEPAVYPEDLFQAAAPSEAGLRRWFVMHTRPRQEKRLAKHLVQSHTPFYLPLIALRRRMRGRTVTSYVPLFPGYVPVFARGEERIAALATRRVVRSLEVPNQEKLWSELRQIEQLIVSGAPITPEERLGPGDKVVIRSGALAGLKGTILRTASGRRFMVQVDFIQRGASVLLDDFVLAEAAD